jgi:hypothetical protein
MFNPFRKKKPFRDIAEMRERLFDLEERGFLVRTVDDVHGECWSAHPRWADVRLDQIHKAIDESYAQNP